MKREAPHARPPRIALWLVDLFASGGHTESILGDLLEEFSDLAGRSGIATARRWFWRQSLKSIGHLAGAELRGSAPWSLAGAVLLGFLLCRFGLRIPESIIIAILRTQTPYSNRHYDFYVWMVTWGIPIVRFIDFTVIGCIVAAVAKGREIVAITAASMATTIVVGSQFFLLARELPPHTPMVWVAFVPNLADWIALLLGGLILRKIRLVSNHRFSLP
jgi:hypothetical protein